MRVLTWNVNSVRVRLERLLGLLERHRPDVVCLQETKVMDDAFPVAEVEAAGYSVALHGQRAYNGVAVLSRVGLTDVQRGFPGDPVPEEARVVSAMCGGLRVVSAYVVNGKAVDDPKYDAKLEWLDAFAQWLQDRQDPAEPLVVAGDFNIAPDDRDVHDPEAWRDRIFCTGAERERLRRLQEWGLVDLLRLHHEGTGPFTWWDYRMGAFARGWGLRIDLVLGTGSVARRCTAVQVDRGERKAGTGVGKPSDHAPVLVDLDLP